MKRSSCKHCRRVLIRCCILVVFILCIIYVCKVGFPSKSCDVHNVDRARIQKARLFAKQVLEAECRPAFAKTEMVRVFNSKYNKDLSIFVKKSQSTNESWYKYSPPFGFRQYLEKLGGLFGLMSEDDLPNELLKKSCKKCVVLGNGGILHGLHLGDLIDQYDIVIRLNNGPVQGFTREVGNKTTIRITYPEGAPVSEQEYNHNSLFVAVLFKQADFKWLEAMLRNESLPLWNRLFFWKAVADKVPLKSSQFRILNPLVMEETALNILQYPAPQAKWFGWEKNIPTMGVTAVILATHLCDEVSLAGFGYDLSQPDTILHYYDNLCMMEMNSQFMHDVTEEKKLLQTLIKEGIVKDLSGGIHCSFCKTQQES